MTREVIFEKITIILKEGYGTNKVVITDDLNDDLYMDSLDRLEFIVMLEKEFTLKRLNDSEIEDLVSIEDCVNYIEAHGQ